MVEDERGMQGQREGTERVKGWEIKRKQSVKDRSMIERATKLLEGEQTFLRRLDSALTARCDPWTLFMCRCISERLCLFVWVQLCIYLSVSITSVSLLIAEWTPCSLHGLHCDYHHLLAHPHMHTVVSRAHTTHKAHRRTIQMHFPAETCK